MKKLAAGSLLLLCTLAGWAQKVVYSEPDRNDYRQTEFEIIGKVNGNILVYKSNRSNYSISVYDMEMKQKDRPRLTFIPERIINTDFIAYPDYCYMFYQYQKRNIVYAMAAKIDGNGKIVGDPITMDTTEISFLASNKIYSLINSDDKQYISLYKINSKHEDNFVVTTLLYNKQLQQLEKLQLNIPMQKRHDYLTEFAVDNDGDIAFARAVQAQENDNVSSLYFLIKKKDSNTVSSKEMDLRALFLDDVRIKVDNYNKRYILTSFYSKGKRSNIDGMYVGVWDKSADSAVAIGTMQFDENLRNDAKGDNGIKNAFNDYYIRNLIVRKDGGFLLAAESSFSSGRGGNYGRYDYMYGSPFLRYPSDYYMFGPSYGYGYPWYRYNNLGQSTRYNSQNIAVFSFDNTGSANWSTVIPKNQYDDESDAFLGYSLLNTGDQLYFLYNQNERRMQLLTSESISASGKRTRNPTLKNLDQGFEFMTHYGKQTGSRQIIFPCMYRNYLCFAKVDF